jgi:hypothetical protein
MKLNHSKAWYEKKAKLEANHSIAAGRFPSEIFDAANTSKPTCPDNSSQAPLQISTAKPAKAKRKA